MLCRWMKRASGHVVASGAALLALSLTLSPAFAQNSPPAFNAYPCPQLSVAAAQPAQAGLGEQPQAPGAPATPEAAQAPAFTPEAFGATGGGESFASSSPGVIGDGGQSGTSSAAIRASSFKIAENQSPRPTNRAYFNYNYFDNVNGTGAGVSRYTPGFERAFGSGNAASFGMNLPVFSTNNDGALGIQGFGNLNMIGKYAFINNPDTGNVLSSGLAVALPTGRSVNLAGASFHDVILQPYMGYIVNSGGGNAYLQGFSSVAVPTDARDITIMFNDISTGYWIYRSNQDQTITGIIPTIEGHLNTPLSHRGLGSGGLQDSFVLTAGSHFIVRQRALFTVGVAVPLTGPLPFDVEAIGQFNWRF